MTTFFATMGVACRPISPLSGSITWSRSKTVRLESPRHLELVEVGGVDLIERRIARAAGVAGVAAPLAVLRTGLGEQRRRRQTEYADGERQNNAPGHFTPPFLFSTC